MLPEVSDLGVVAEVYPPAIEILGFFYFEAHSSHCLCQHALPCEALYEDHRSVRGRPWAIDVLRRLHRGI